MVNTTQFKLTQKTVHPTREDAAEQAREYVRRHWKYREPTAAAAQAVCGASSDCQFGPPANLLDRALSHFLCISGMAFQDAWNVDLERLKRCCIHVITQEGKLVPFCAYYMTSTSGRRLIDIGNPLAG